jgi:hypothetical protein
MQELLNLLSEVVRNQEQPPKIKIKFNVETEREQTFNDPEFIKWCNDHNVGMLWDRSTIHLG